MANTIHISLSSSFRALISDLRYDARLVTFLLRKLINCPEKLFCCDNCASSDFRQILRFVNMQYLAKTAAQDNLPIKDPTFCHHQTKLIFISLSFKNVTTKSQHNFELCTPARQVLKDANNLSFRNCQILHLSVATATWKSFSQFCQQRCQRLRTYCSFKYRQIFKCDWKVKICCPYLLTSRCFPLYHLTIPLKSRGKFFASLSVKGGTIPAFQVYPTKIFLSNPFHYT